MKELSLCELDSLQSRELSDGELAEVVAGAEKMGALIPVIVPIIFPPAALIRAARNRRQGRASSTSSAC